MARVGKDWIQLDGAAKKGTLVRFAPGTDWQQTIKTDPSMALVLKRYYGQDIAFSAWCGDWDPHALNHPVPADGTVLHMDRNNGNLIESLSAPLNRGEPPTPAQMAETKRIMLTRMKTMWTAAVGGQKLYQPTAWMERYLSMDDFAPTPKKINDLSPDVMRQRLNAIADLTEAQKHQIIAQLQLRPRLLPEVLDEFLQWTRTRGNSLAPNEWITPKPTIRVQPMPIQPLPIQGQTRIWLRQAA